MGKQSLTPVLLLTLSGVLAASLAFLDPEEVASEFQWTPVSVEDSGPIVFEKGTPKELLISFAGPLGNTSSASKTELVGFGSWGVGHSEHNLYLFKDSGETAVVAASEDCDSGCELSLQMSGGEREPVLRFENFRTTNKKVPLSGLNWDFSVTELVAYPSGIAGGLSVSGLTAPSGLVQTETRIFALISSLVALFAALVLLSKSRFESRSCPIRRVPDDRYSSTQDYVVFFLLIVGSLVLPAYSDDHWVIESARGLVEDGVISSLFAPQSFWLPTGTVFYLLYAGIVTVTEDFFVMRLVPLVFLITGWLVFRLTILNPRDFPHDRLLGWGLSSLYLSFAMGWLVTLRPEPFIVLLSFVFIGSAWRYLARGDHLYAALAIFFSGFAISTHQAGLVMIFPALGFSGIWLFRVFRKREWVEGLKVALLAFTLLAIVTFPIYDLGSILDAISDWRGLETHSQGLSEELSRWVRVLSNDLLIREVTGLIALIAFSFGFVVWPKQDAERQLHFIVLSAPFGLFLTASKWEWHFGALAAPTLFLILSVSRGLADYAAMRRDSFARELSLLGFWALGLLAVIVSLTKDLLGPREYLLVALSVLLFSLVMRRLTPRHQSRLGAISLVIVLTVSGGGTFFGMHRQGDLRNTFLESGFVPTPKPPHPGLEVASTSTIYLPCAAADVESVSADQFLVDLRVRPTLLVDCDNDASRDVWGFWVRARSEGEVVRSPSILVGGQTFGPVEVAEAESSSHDFASEQISVWSLYLFELPKNPGSGRVVFSSENLEAAKEERTDLYRFRGFSAEEVVSLGKSYGPVYDATLYSNISLLRSGEGIWPYPEVLVASRGTGDFLEPLRGGNALALGVDGRTRAELYLFSIVPPGGLVSTRR